MREEREREGGGGDGMGERGEERRDGGLKYYMLQGSFI